MVQHGLCCTRDGCCREGIAQVATSARGQLTHAVPFSWVITDLLYFPSGRNMRAFQSFFYRDYCIYPWAKYVAYATSLSVNITYVVTAESMAKTLTYTTQYTLQLKFYQKSGYGSVVVVTHVNIIISCSLN